MTHPNSKRERRERHPFSPAFFSLGTECEVIVSLEGDTKVITVTKVTKNGPFNYVLHTGKEREDGALPEMYAIANVVRIVKRAPGVMKIDRSNDLINRKNHFSLQFEMDYMGVKKHPSEYRTTSLEGLVFAIMTEYVKDDQLVDGQKLVDMLRDQGVFNITVPDALWGYPIYRVNKKKLRAAIRSILSKCLLKQHRTQKKQDAVDFSQPYRWDHGIEDFVRENAHEVETGENEIILQIPPSVKE